MYRLFKLSYSCESQMTRKKEKNPFDITPSNVRAYDEQVRRMLGDPKARMRRADGKYAEDAFKEFKP